MSSSLATNASLPSHLVKKRYLQVDQNGVPVDRCVPQSIQVYSGAGGEVVAFDGSNVFYVNSTLAGGVLNVTLTDEDMRNLLNRCVKVVVPNNIANNVVFTLPVGSQFISTDAASDTLQTFTYAAAAAQGFTSTFCFVSVNRVGLL